MVPALGAELDLPQLDPGVPGRLGHDVPEEGGNDVLGAGAGHQDAPGRSIFMARRLISL